MKRGDFYRVSKPSATDPKRFRVFLVVSRQALIDSKFSTVVCAPVYTSRHGLSTQVPVGVDEGLRHDSSIHCDELVSLPKSMLTHFVGSLPFQRMAELDRAMVVALGVNTKALGARNAE
ncbi:MAG TPA: type II toxin-antitoxin system PemK/MazF family toxin [Vicinamibacterales bacterium]|nr:type II toxin-antitoxin system PemK/MazF family toxin [Vicinamibacterales bacterium]